MRVKRGKTSYRGSEWVMASWMPSASASTVNGPTEEVAIHAIESYDERGNAVRVYVRFDTTDDPQFLDALSVMLQKLAQGIRDTAKLKAKHEAKRG